MNPGIACALLVGALVVAACGDGGSTGPSDTPPTITAQPQDATVDPGASAMFSVTASGEDLTYRWHRDGEAIMGATASSYTVGTALAQHDGAEYHVVVTNAAGSVTSNAAELIIRIPATITSPPLVMSSLSGTPIPFLVETIGRDVTYQWSREGVPIPGATSSIYAVGMPLLGDHNATYTVAVANAWGADTSEAHMLDVMMTNRVRNTSHANAKAFNRAPADVPVVSSARAFGDFFGTGPDDYFVATLVYDVQAPQAQAQPGEFRFYRWTGAGYVHDAAKIDNAAGCIHPRKAIVADFNRDERSDVFVVCHGYDAAPFPGEPNYVLLSQPDGVYRRSVVANGLTGFHHSATAFDINHDGINDVVVTNSQSAAPIFALIGGDNGTFTPNYTLFPGGQANYFTVEAADVNGDAMIDIIAGGHEWENAPTVVMLNNGTPSFVNAPRHVLPAVAGEGVVLDFTVFDSDRNGASDIYVLRTSGGDGTFYQSRTVQRVTWPDLNSTVLVSERPAQWIDFLFPVYTNGSYSLVSDMTSQPFTLELH